MMNMTDFDQLIDPIILKRGQTILANDELSEVTWENRTIMMIAHGTKDYRVSVTLDDNMEIISHSCTCPYDHGPICKHVAALLLLIREDRLEDFLEEDEEEDIPVIKDRIKAILSSLDRETLERIIIKEAQDNPDLFKTLTYRYDEDDNKINLAQRTVRAAIDDVESYGYSDEILEQANDEIYAIFYEAEHANSMSYAIRLLQAIIIEALEFEANEADYVSFVVFDTLSVFKTLIEKHQDDESIRCEIYHGLEQIITDQIELIDDDIKADLLSSMQASSCKATSHAFQKRLNDILDNPETTLSLRTKIEIAKYQHLSVFASPMEAKDYLHLHLDNDALLEISYDLAMKDEDYTMAVRCAKMVLEKQKPWWNKGPYESKLIDALMGLGAYEEAKPLLRSHVMKDDVKAYHMFVRLLSEEELRSEIDAFLEAFMKEPHHTRVFKLIATAFGEHERLMGYAERFPQIIEYVYDVLVDTYRERVSKVFRRMILARAESASNRKAYRDVSRTIENARTAIGEDVDAFIFELVELYRRSALKDELWKLHGVRLRTQKKSF